MIGRYHLELRVWGAIGALSVLLLGGCTAGPDWDAIPQQAAQIRSACEGQHPESARAPSNAPTAQSTISTPTPASPTWM